MRSEVKKKRTESLVFGDKILHITPYLPYICRESPPTRKDNQMVTAKTKNMEKKRNRQRRVVSEKAGYKTMIQPISIQYQARKTWIFAFWCWGVELVLRWQMTGRSKQITSIGGIFSWAFSYYLPSGERYIFLFAQVLILHDFEILFYVTKKSDQVNKTISRKNNLDPATQQNIFHLFFLLISKKDIF